MEFKYIGEGIDAVVIDNFYNEDQLKDIMIELKFLTRKDVLVGPENLSTAENAHGSASTKTGVFLENVYKQWEHSPLIKHSRDNLVKPEVVNKLQEFNSLYRILYWLNSRSHLLSYYENSSYYSPHRDDTVFTVLNWFHSEPKKFTGGDMKLFTLHPTDDIKNFNNSMVANIEFKHNRVVILAGCTFHEVTKISSDDDNFNGDGRYCNSIFYNLYPEGIKKAFNREIKNDSN